MGFFFVCLLPFCRDRLPSFSPLVISSSPSRCDMGVLSSTLRIPQQRQRNAKRALSVRKNESISSMYLTLPLMATHASPSRWCAATCSIVSLPSFLGGGAGTDERDFSTAACSELELRKSAMTAYPSDRNEVGDDAEEALDDDACFSPLLCPRTERVAALEGSGVTLHMTRKRWEPVRRRREGGKERARRENECERNRGVTASSRGVDRTLRERLSRFSSVSTSTLLFLFHTSVFFTL